jgi:hypothetical protein
MWVIVNTMMNVAMVGVGVAVFVRVTGTSSQVVVPKLGNYIGLVVGALQGVRKASQASAGTTPANPMRTGMQKVGVGYNRIKYDIWSATRFRPQPLMSVPPAAASQQQRPAEAVTKAAASNADLQAAVTGSAHPPAAGVQSAGDVIADYYRERRMLPP